MQMNLEKLRQFCNDSQGIARYPDKKSRRNKKDGKPIQGMWEENEL